MGGRRRKEKGGRQRREDRRPLTLERRNRKKCLSPVVLGKEHVSYFKRKSLEGSKKKKTDWRGEERGRRGGGQETVRKEKGRTPSSRGENSPNSIGLGKGRKTNSAQEGGARLQSVKKGLGLYREKFVSFG